LYPRTHNKCVQCTRNNTCCLGSLYWHFHRSPWLRGHIYFQFNFNARVLQANMPGINRVIRASTSKACCMPRPHLSEPSNLWPQHQQPRKSAVKLMRSIRKKVQNTLYPPKPDPHHNWNALKTKCCQKLYNGIRYPLYIRTETPADRWLFWKRIPNGRNRYKWCPTTSILWARFWIMNKINYHTNWFSVNGKTGFKGRQSLNCPFINILTKGKRLFLFNGFYL